MAKQPTPAATAPKKSAPAAQPQTSSSNLPVVQGASAVKKFEDVPDYLKDYEGKHDGLENTDQSDFLIPRLGLSQALSDELKRSHPKHIPGLQVGQLFNTATKHVYGEEVFMIPLFHSKNRIKWNEPRGSGIDCIAQDGQNGSKYGKCADCKFALFADGEKPECTEFKGWVSLIENEPIGVSFKSTGLKVAKQLTSTIRLRNVPAYAQRFRVSVTTETRQGNEYYQFVVTPAGFTPKEFVEQAEEYFNRLRTAGVVIDTSGEGEEEGGRGDRDRGDI